MTGFTLPNQSKDDQVSNAKDCVHHTLTLKRIEKIPNFILFHNDPAEILQLHVFSWYRMTVYMRIILLKQKAHRWNLSTWLWPDKCIRGKNMQSTRTHMNFMEISDHSVKQWNSENQFKPDGYKIKITYPVKAFEKLIIKNYGKKNVWIHA